MTISFPFHRHVNEGTERNRGILLEVGPALMSSILIKLCEDTVHTSIVGTRSELAYCMELTLCRCASNLRSSSHESVGLLLFHPFQFILVTNILDNKELARYGF